MPEKRKRISDRHAKRMSKLIFPDGENPNTPIARSEFIFMVEQINNYYLNLPSKKELKIDPDQTAIDIPPA